MRIENLPQIAAVANSTDKDTTNTIDDINGDALAASLEDVLDMKESIHVGPSHHTPCSEQFHTLDQVRNSQKEYNWKIVDPFSATAKWESWKSIGLEVPDKKYEISWTECADQNHALTGIMRHGPGQVEPLHHHSAPMIYYILQGEPIITLNGIKNRASTWQCVSIPAFCPHRCYNDTKDDVVIAWTYLTNVASARPKPGKGMAWKFLEPGF